LDEIIGRLWSADSVCNLWVKSRGGFLINSKVVAFNLLDACLGWDKELLETQLIWRRLTLTVYARRTFVKKGNYYRDI